MTTKCANCGKPYNDHEIQADGIYCPDSTVLYTPMTAEQAIEQRIDRLEKKIDLETELLQRIAATSGQLDQLIAWCRDNHGYIPGPGKTQKEKDE